MWRHSKFIYFLFLICLSQEHDDFINNIATMASLLVAQQKNLQAVIVVGGFCSSCDLEREIIRRVQSINQLPVIAINHDSDVVHNTSLSINQWKSEVIVFHVVPYSFRLQKKPLHLDRKNRKIFVVVNEPLRVRPILWDSVWIEMFYIYSFLKTFNIYYIVFLKDEAHLFTRDKDFKELQVSVKDDIVQDRLKYLTGNVINVAQYHNPPLSVIKHGRVYGYDSKFLDIVCKLLNVSYNLDFLTVNVGRLDDDRVLTTLIKVTSTLAYFSFNTREISRSSVASKTSSLTNHLSGTYPLEITSVCAVVPRGDKYSTIRNIIHVFEPLTWLIIGVVFVGIGPIFWLPKTSSNLSDVYFSLWEIQLLGASTQRSALGWNKGLKILFLLYNFLILSIFSTDLVALLTKPHYDTDIDTLEELNRSSLNMLMSTAIALEIREIRGEEFLPKEITLVQGPFSNLVHNLRSMPATGFVTTENMIRLFMESKATQDSAGEARYHVVKECYYNIYRTYLSSEGNPYEEKVSLYQSWVTEAGLFIHWMRFVNFNFGSADTKTHYGMTFVDFIMAFYILIVGYLIALTVFVVEILLTRINKRLNH